MKADRFFKQGDRVFHNKLGWGSVLRDTDVEMDNNARIPTLLDNEVENSTWDDKRYYQMYVGNVTLHQTGETHDPDWDIHQAQEYFTTAIGIDSITDMTERIGEWRQETFGDVKGMSLEDRMFVEVSELRDELPTDGGHYTHNAILKESCDVIVTIMAWCHYNNIDLAIELDKVQSINESRKWKRHNDGTGQHIEEEV